MLVDSIPAHLHLLSLSRPCKPPPPNPHILLPIFRSQVFFCLLPTFLNTCFTTSWSSFSCFNLYTHFHPFIHVYIENWGLYVRGNIMILGNLGEYKHFLDQSICLQMTFSLKLNKILLHICTTFYYPVI